MTSYSESTQEKMKEFYNTLNEKDRRGYAAIEALKLGHGGIIYISKVLGCDRKTVSKGVKELEKLTRANKVNEQNEPEDKSKTQVDEACSSINNDSNDSYLEIDSFLNHDTPHQKVVAQNASKDENKSYDDFHAENHQEIKNDQESETRRDQDKQNNSPTSVINPKNNDQKQSQCNSSDVKGSDKKKKKKNKQRVRKSGAGRKTKSDEIPSLDQKILDILTNHTAGDPSRRGRDLD